jgi:hypothetical protein
MQNMEIGGILLPNTSSVLNSGQAQNEDLLLCIIGTDRY